MCHSGPRGKNIRIPKKSRHACSRKSSDGRGGPHVTGGRSGAKALIQFTRGGMRSGSVTCRHEKGAREAEVRQGPGNEGDGCPTLATCGGGVGWGGGLAAHLKNSPSKKLTFSLWLYRTFWAFDCLGSSLVCCCPRLFLLRVQRFVDSGGGLKMLELSKYLIMRNIRVLNNTN